MAKKNVVKIGNVNLLEVKELSELDAWQQAVRYEAKQDVLDLETLQLTDIKNKIANREKLKTFLMWLLICQNIAVFLIVTVSLILDRVKSLHLFFQF